MKTLTILFVAAIMMGVGCSKSEDSENNPDKPDKPSPLPDLPDPNDVCSCMDDIIFMQYCYDNFDVSIYNHRTTKTNQKYPSVNL